MKISPSHRNDESDAKKNERPHWQEAQRRRQLHGEADAAAKYRQTDSALKEDTKFISILETAAKPQKVKHSGEDASREQGDDSEKDKKQTAREVDSSDQAAIADRVERNAFSGGGQFGGSGGFGGGGGIQQTLNLNENFAARSILHIADLERIISAVRTQTKIGGKREIQLELKRSVLEGLKVKITTDPAAQVQIEFVAANEKVRSQIEDHSSELAEILRGRGINLQSLRTTLDSGTAENPSLPNSAGDFDFESKNSAFQSAADDSAAENTFENAAESRDV